ncbi:hypothetical protein [Desulfobulbus elongatus]|uniref:hypothetical protein n=1 Tax=Desulfobulbus elongatus TaxID=53332 RepID=UPI000481626A|nr:hypothetical protein [Desulfobulbus elongatus]
MESFNKSNLVYTYNWALYEKDDPRISGIPDATAFNRKEGQEVLYIINCLTDHLAYGVDSFGNKIEKLLHDRLPEEIDTQGDTIAWIKKNWTKFTVGQS